MTRNTLFIIAGAVLAVVLSVWYVFFRTPAPDIILTLNHPGDVKAGEPFSVAVEFSNGSDKILNGTTVSLALPSGFVFAGEDASVRVGEKSIGDVGPGSVTKETFTVIALQGTESVQSLSTTVRYGTSENARTRYEANTTSDIRVGGRAVPFTLSFPSSVVLGESFEATIAYRNDSQNDYRNLRLEVSYPPEFKLKTADPEPTKAQNGWDVPLLRKGEAQTVTIRGTAAGAPGSLMRFRVQMIANVLGEETAITDEEGTVSITPSPLSLAVTVNNTDSYIAGLEDILTYTISYTNNAPQALENVTLTARLKGELFDFGTAETNGSFNSVTNTFVWNAANTRDLARVEAGALGSVTLTIRVKKEFPITRIGDKNYILAIEAAGSSPTVPSGSMGVSTMALATLETKVRGRVDLAAKGYFRDAASAVINTGPYPPRANQTTQYSVHWILKNYGTNVSNVVIRASLQSGAKVTKIISSTENTQPQYNPASGEVSWTIPAIPATRGVVSPPPAAVFQIEATPAITQIGRDMVLMSEATLSAADDFTGAALSVTARAVTTDLLDDPSITISDRHVQP